MKAFETLSTKECNYWREALKGEHEETSGPLFTAMLTQLLVRRLSRQGLHFITAKRMSDECRIGLGGGGGSDGGYGGGFVVKTGDIGEKICPW